MGQKGKFFKEEMEWLHLKEQRSVLRLIIRLGFLSSIELLLTRAVTGVITNQQSLSKEGTLGGIMFMFWQSVVVLSRLASRALYHSNCELPA